MLLKLKIISFSLIIIFLMSKIVYGLNNQPIISVYNLNNYSLNQEFNKIVKNSLIRELNNKNFLTEDANHILKLRSNDVREILTKVSILKNIESDIIIFLNSKILNIQENQIFINLKAEIYNVKLRKFITSWSLPSKEIKINKDCDDICKNFEITSNLILMSNLLGKSITNILSLNFQMKKNKNVIKKYNLTISGLNNDETLSLTDIMINEFPGFVKIIDKEQYGTQYKYSYYSSANNLKIKKWLTIALKELGLIEGENIEVTLNSDLIFINKYPNNLSSGSKGNIIKFN